MIDAAKGLVCMGVLIAKSILCLFPAYASTKINMSTSVIEFTGDYLILL